MRLRLPGLGMFVLAVRRVVGTVWRWWTTKPPRWRSGVELGVVAALMVLLRLVGDGLPDQTELLRFGLAFFGGLGAGVLAKAIIQPPSGERLGDRAPDRDDAASGRRLAHWAVNACLLLLAGLAVHWLVAVPSRAMSVARDLGVAAERSLVYLVALAGMLLTTAWREGQHIPAPSDALVVGAARVAALIVAGSIAVKAIPLRTAEWKGVVAVSLFLFALVAVIMVPRLVYASRRGNRDGETCPNKRRGDASVR